MTNPISLHEANPHYFVYKNKPTLLVTSAEHYGAVLNGAFDYRKYLEELKACGNNLTRVFCGTQREFPGVCYDEYNTLAPKSKDFLCPYKRSDVKGSNDARNKFDLDLWDESFFSRLDSFVKEAALLDIIVELTFFCPFYSEGLGNATWNLSPYHPDNNINGIGTAGLDALFVWEDAGYIKYQTSLICKLVEFLNPNDNLMFEIINEPYLAQVSPKFQTAISEIITNTEKNLPKKHLITQNIANGCSEIENPNPLISVFNFHYATPPRAVEVNYSLNKPIGCNETGFALDNLGYTFRHQAWEFMLAGGALFNNLDFSFAVGNECGSGESQCPHTGGSHALRMQYGFLRKFIEYMDFINMHPANHLIYSVDQTPPEGYLLANPGRQYAFYLTKAILPNEIGFVIEAGEYFYDIFDPIECLPIQDGHIMHPGGTWLLSLKKYAGCNISEIVIKVAQVS